MGSLLKLGIVGLAGFLGYKGYKKYTAKSSAILTIKQMMISDKPGQTPDEQAVNNLATDYVGNNLGQLQMDAGLLVTQGYLKTAVLFQTQINNLSR